MKNKRKKNIRSEFYDLRLKGRESYLKFMDVDIKKVRELEKQLDGKYDVLAAKVRRELKNSGGDIAKRHLLSLERNKRMMQKEAEFIQTRGGQSGSTQIDTGLPDYVTVFRPRCFCWPLFSTAFTLHGDDTEVVPATGGTGEADVTFESSGNRAHSFVEVRGQGTGTINEATAKAWYIFAFTPVSDGAYCIRPIVQMNGHWLVWTWGTCGGTSEDVGNGYAKAKISVEVSQLTIPLRTKDHVVLDQNFSAGGDDQSGVYYDSTTDGGIATSAVLEGGHEAVVKVTCETNVRIANHGRAWVDLKTSPQFYYQAPELYWGRAIC